MRYPALHMKMCKTAWPSQQQLSFCYAFAGDCPPKAYSTEFYRATAKHTHGIAIDIDIDVCLSVSPSLNLYNRKWTILTKLIIIAYSLVHMIFSRSPVKGQVRQRRPWKSREIDRFGTAKETCIKTHTNTSCSQATK